MKIISIDIGIINLGLVKCTIWDDWTIKSIDSIQLIDIRKECLECKTGECPHRHDRCFTDYMNHFFDNHPELNNADHILIERQPPQGLVSIQELILNKYRETVVLICPRSVHKHFSITHLNYDERKIASVVTAQEVLSKFDRKLSGRRNHDIADAICQLCWFLHHTKPTIPSIESFAYKPRLRATLEHISTFTFKQI